jgi:hypothetical protein
MFSPVYEPLPFPPAAVLPPFVSVPVGIAFSVGVTSLVAMKLRSSLG